MKPKSQKWARTRKQSRRFKQRELRWRITVENISPEALVDMLSIENGMARKIRR
jgi:hypothetical protein